MDSEAPKPRITSVLPLTVFESTLSPNGSLPFMVTGPSGPVQPEKPRVLKLPIRTGELPLVVRLGMDPLILEEVQVTLAPLSARTTFEETAVTLPPPDTLTVRLAASAAEAPKPTARTAAVAAKRARLT